MEDNILEIPFEKSKSISFIDKIIVNKKVGISLKNSILDEEENLVKQYFLNNTNKDLYYVSGISSKNPENVVLYYLENNEISIKKNNINEMPEDYYINCVVKLKDQKFIMDKISSYTMALKLNSMIKRFLNEQQEELQKFRKENHLYRVEEDIESRVFLCDISDESNVSFEEVEFPEELLQFAKEGAVFKYINGSYELCK